MLNFPYSYRVPRRAFLRAAGSLAAAFALPERLLADPYAPPHPDGGQLWIGDNGQRLVADMYGRNPRLLDAKRDAEVKAAPPPVKYPRVASVYQEWIDAAKAGTQAGSSFAGHAGPLTQMVLLGNLAVRAGRPIDLDPVTGEVKTTGIPAEWITPAYRAGWRM